MNTPKAFGYILSSQSHDFKQHTPEFHKIFVETDPANQTELMECIKQLHTGDSLHFPSIRSAFNNVDQFSKLIALLTSKGCTVHFHDEDAICIGDSFVRIQSHDLLNPPLETKGSPTVARGRESLMPKRQSISANMRNIITPDIAEEIRRRVAQGESKTKLAAEYGCSRETIYFHLRRG